MTKWLIKTAFFVWPFLGLYVINTLYTSEKEGDLARLGYVYANPSPMRTILQRYRPAAQSILLSTWLQKKTTERLDLLVIGDSFSEQDPFGYTNFLSALGVTVVQANPGAVRRLPIQYFAKLHKGGVLDSLRPRFVLVESVERAFLEPLAHLDTVAPLLLAQVKKEASPLRKYRAAPSQTKCLKPLFSKNLFQIPLTNLLYYFQDKPAHVDIYRIATTRNDLFSGGATDVLLYRDDIDRLKEKNDTTKLIQMNAWFNQMAKTLAEKDIQLIVLICPDKYDLYYPYLKPQYPKSNFFAHYKTLPKKYHAPAIFEGLSALLPATKDVYFYDDSHWSPIGAKYTAEILEEIVRGE